jgi:hypothetical protein
VGCKTRCPKANLLRPLNLQEVCHRFPLREGTTICWLAALSINSTIAFSMVERLGVALGV